MATKTSRQTDVDANTQIRAAIEAVQTNILIADLNRRITYANPMAIVTLTQLIDEVRKVAPDFDIERLVGTNIDIFHGKRAAMIAKLLADTSNLPHRAEIKLGDAILALNINGVFDASGTHSGYVVEWSDTTERREREAREAALAKEMAKIRAATESVQTNLMIAGLDRVISYANPMTVKTLGRLEDEVQKVAPSFRIDKLIGTNIDIFHGKRAAMIAKLLADTSNLPHRAEIKLGDAILALNINGIFDDAGAHSGYVVEWSDVTEQRAQEVRDAQLAREMAQIRAATESVQTNLMIAGLDRVITYANPRTVKTLTGLIEEVKKVAPSFDVDRIVGTNIDIFHGKRAEMIAKLLADPKNLPHSANIKLGDAILALNINGVFDKDGNHAGFVVEWDDVTVRRQLREQVESIAAITTERSNEIGNAATSLKEATLEQLASVNETTAAVTEITQIAREAVARSEDVIRQAEEAAVVYQQGRAAVDGNVGAMNEIKKQMETIAETIVDLSERTQAVGDIIASVKDIAEQSNLLALNASIEAARAGDQGRGFAVVATEMRSLADQSKQAANQVRIILGEIQKAAHTAVTVAETGGDMVSRGVDQARESGKNIESLAVAIEANSRSAQQIAASTRQQEVGMEQIAEAIGRVKDTATAAQASSEQLNQNADQLRTVAAELQAGIQKLN